MIRPFLQVSLLFEPAMILESRREAPMLIWELPISESTTREKLGLRAAFLLHH